MNKILSIVVILGLLAAGPIAIAGDAPIVTFPGDSSTSNFKVYRFWDSTFSTLCYTTQNSIACIPYGDLTSNSQKRIRAILEKFGEDHIPPIIKLQPSDIQEGNKL